MFIVTMLKFDRQHCLERLHRLGYGIVEYAVDDVECCSPKDDAMPLCCILQTAPQKVVFGYNFRDIEARLPAEQSVFCRNGVGVSVFISGFECFCEGVQKFRHLVVDRRCIEVRRARKFANLPPPGSKQLLALVFDDGD